MAAVTAIVALELLTSYAEDTKQWVWPLLNQLKHSHPTILTSHFRNRLIAEAKYWARPVLPLVNLIRGEYSSERASRLLKKSS